ncbi:MAG: hypothetical protein L3J96_06570 [Thermoplasmata archaeon]|nr:hypothetical protein [Thermoplasmata archaeon]
MNSRIALLGVGIILLAIGLLLFPVASTGAESLDVEVQLGIFVLPVGLSVVLWGAAAPDPSVTTVGGLFGNVDENELRRRESKAPSVGPARFLPHPHESVNCRNCYTAIAADLITCPRCGLVRSCRVCGGRVKLAGQSPRCAKCGRDEAYCNCPKLKKGRSVGTSGHGARG